MATSFDIAVVAIRLLSLYLFVKTLVLFPGILTIDRDKAIAHILIGVLISIVLWVVAIPVTRMTLPKHVNDTISSSFSYTRLERMFIMLLGFYLIVSGIPDVFLNLAKGYYFKSVIIGKYMEESSALARSELASVLVNLALGFLLVTCPGKIQKLLHSLQQIKWVR
jgi:prepilin signal peptidase PulO-like enzyme (type II secretory pathway)